MSIMPDNNPPIGAFFVCCCIVALGIIGAMVAVGIIGNHEDDIAGHAVLNSTTYQNDNTAMAFKQIYYSTETDSAVPDLYVFEFHNRTGWHYANVWIEHSLIVDSVGFDDPGYKWIMDKYG